MADKLAKPIPKFSLATTTDVIRRQLGDIADKVGSNLAPPQLVDAYAHLSELLSVCDSITEVVKGQLKTLVAKEGEVVTEAGTRRLQVGKYQVEIRPYRSGLDPKKVESLLRAKRASLDKYMDTEVKYKVSQAKLLVAVEEQVLTRDELDTCKYEESWTLQPPKRTDD